MPSPTPDTAPRERGAGERIAKLLARAGIASRREVERMIAEGRIARDGVLIDTPATLLTSLDGITVDGQPVAAPAPARLFVYHKPVGLLVTERDPAGRPTIYDRLPPELPRVVPVGRLDLATEGLLLLTTDGGLKRLLELPSTGVERTYRARAYGPVSQAQLEELIHGVEIEGMRYGPIDANLERRTGANGWIEMTLTEGKNREVRRVLEYLGLEVSRLIRTRYGPFELAELAPGEVGEIRQNDLEVFRKTLKGGGQAAGGAMQSVVAQPLVKRAPAPSPAPSMVTSDRPRARPARPPAGRDGSERRPAPGARQPARAATDRERPASGDRPRRDRPPVSPARPRSTGDRGPTSASGAGLDPRDDRRDDRPTRPSGQRDERPRSFGDRTRAAAVGRAARPASDDRSRTTADARPTRSTAHTAPSSRTQRDDRGGERRDKTPARGAQGKAPRTERTARPGSDASAPRRPASRPAGGHAPRDDRSPRGMPADRGKSPDRGKPSGPHRPSGRPSGPRGKR